MYNSLIFINFISRSKKVKPKSKSCRKHLFTVNKLLRLWYFVSVLNLKFLDQLERRHCKDTPFFRPFYIRAPKGPFLWGLINIFIFFWGSGRIAHSQKANRCATTHCKGDVPIRCAFSIVKNRLIYGQYWAETEKRFDMKTACLKKKKNVDHFGLRPLINNRHLGEPLCFS